MEHSGDIFSHFRALIISTTALEKTQKKRVLKDAFALNNEDKKRLSGKLLAGYFKACVFGRLFAKKKL